MDFSFNSLLIYSLVFFGTLVLAFFYKSSKAPRTFLTATFSLLVIFTGLRYRVGNDYIEYIRQFRSVEIYNSSRLETGFSFLNRLFVGYEDGFVYVMLIAAFLTLFLLFSSYINYNIILAGTFFFFTTEFVLMMNDQVRQALMLAVFIYSLKYIIEDDFLKYILIISIGAFLFHYSGFLLIPIYFLKSIDLKNKTWVILLILAYCSFLFNWFDSLFYYLIGKIPYYGEKYIQLQESRFLMGEEFTGTGLGILFNLFVFTYVGYFFKGNRFRKLYSIFMISGILYFLFLDYFIALRFISYLIFIELILLPILVTHIWDKKTSLPLIIGHIFYFVLLTAFEAGKHGGYPYQNFLFQ